MKEAIGGRMKEAIQFLISSITHSEKLYLARLLDREGFVPSNDCYEGMCADCKDDACIHKCHIC